MSEDLHQYHSGKFCPISKMNCRSDCASLRSFDFCMLIDGAFSLSRRMEDFLAEFSYERYELLEKVIE